METPVFDILEQAAQNRYKGVPFVMVTVVQAIDSTPGRSGFKMIVLCGRTHARHRRRRQHRAQSL